MKKTVCALACLLVALNGMAALAQDEAVLGKSHYTAELDAMFLQHRTFDTDDGGVYFGLAGYGHMGDNWYLGGEIGVGAGFGLFLVDSSSYMPIELNAKRAFALSPSFVVDLGAGLSYSRVEFSHDSLFSDDDWEVTEWVFGGQVMSDLYFKAGSFLLGLKVKYQLTQDVEDVASVISPDEGWDYSNLKIGFQIGFRFSD
jgi:hypothetical protein